MASIQRKKSRKKWIIFFLLLLLGGAGLGVKLYGPKPEKFVSVTTEKVQLRTITQIVTASGKIQPETMVKINAEVSGEIILLPVKEGQSVKHGELLVRIKPDQYQAQVDRATAALRSTQAQLALQDASLEKALSEYKRATDLFQKRLTSEQEFVAAKIAKQIAKAQYDAALAGIAQAEAALKEAKESLAKTSIYSPMEGTVSQLKSELGERVSGSNFTQGTEMMTISDLTKMEAKVDVGENDVVLVAIGNHANLEIDAYSQKKFHGEVVEIANTAKTKGAGQDEVTNFEVKIRILDKDVQLRPGMSVTTDIETTTHRDVLCVPIQSVTTRMPKKKPEEEAQKAAPTSTPSKTSESKALDKPQEIVFIVEKDRVKMYPVQRGINDENYVEILSGVEGNMQVVSGSYKAINRELEEGMLVQREGDKNQPKNIAK